MSGQFIRECIAAAFLGSLHGDRLGLPWEMQTAAQILARTNGEGVTKVVQIPADHAFKEVAGLPFGSTSDDWGMFAATARAIISHGRRELDEFFRLTLARELSDELERCDIGYGTGTKIAVRQMNRWLRGELEDSRSPLERAPKLAPMPGKKNVGSGNGVAIRIGPVGIALGFLPWTRPVLMDIGFMTHSDPRASVAGYVLGILFKRIAEAHMGMTGTDRIIQGMRKRLGYEQFLAEIVKMELEYCRQGRAASIHMLSHRLHKVMLEPATLRSNASLRRAVGNSVLCWESVPYAIGVFLRNLDDPQAAIREAVNGGGDTDSIASIVGSLMGLLHGLAALPDDWKQGKDAQSAITLGYRFCDVITGGRL